MSSTTLTVGYVLCPPLGVNTKPVIKGEMVRANRALYEALRPIMLEKVKKHMAEEDTKALLLQLIRLQGTMLEVLTKVVTRMDEKEKVQAPIDDSHIDYGK